MFHNENYKLRAKTLNSEEGVSGTDTSTSCEAFAAEVCKLQLEDSFSEVPKVMKRLFAIILTVAMVMVPQIARAALAQIFTIDTVAGFGTVVKLSSAQVGATAQFLVKKPDLTKEVFETKVDEKGKASVELDEKFTRKAGTYRIAASVAGSWTPATSFEVFPDDPDSFASRIYSDRSTLNADGLSLAKITIRLQDRFGNSVSGHQVGVLSNRAGDAIVSDEQLAFTDEQGNADFYLKSVLPGQAVLTAVDKTSDMIFEKRLNINFSKSRSFSLAIGGNDVIGAASMLAVASGTDPNSDSDPDSGSGPDSGSRDPDTVYFDVGDIDGDVLVNENASFAVTAMTVEDSTDTSYRGTIEFTSTDPNAVLPNDYTFQASDLGKHVFNLSLTFKTIGAQTLTVTDANDGTIMGDLEVNVLAARGAAVSADEVIITQPTAGRYGVNNFEVEGTASPTSTVTVFDNGRQLGNVQSGADGKFTYEAKNLEDGDHAIYAESGGEISAEVVINVDATAASVEDFSVTPNPVAPGGTVGIAVRTDAGMESVSVIMSDIILQLVQEARPNDDTYKGTLTAPATAGSYPMDVLLVDQQGNEASFAAVSTLTVDESLQNFTGDLSFHVPSRVIGVTVSPGPSKVNLQWNPSTDDTGIAFYRIYYGIDRNNLNLVANTFDASTRWYVANLRQGVQYFFQVVGVDDENNEGDQRSVVVGAVPASGQDSQVSYLGFSGAAPAPLPNQLPQDGPGILGLLIPLWGVGIYGYLRSRRQSKRL